MFTSPSHTLSTILVEIERKAADTWPAVTFKRNVDHLRIQGRTFYGACGPAPLNILLKRALHEWKSRQDDALENGITNDMAMREEQLEKQFPASQTWSSMSGALP